MKKAISRLTAAFPFSTENEVSQVVCKYHKSNPDDTKVSNIVEQCSKVLTGKNGIAPEVEIIETIKISPLQEILKILPQAKASYIEGLLAKFGNQTNDVLQDMLEKGYEREVANSSSSSSASERDYTSTSWETTPLYRQNATVELENNFPFVKVKELATCFASHKHHYYPTYKTVFEVFGNVARYNVSTGEMLSFYSPLLIAELRSKCKKGDPTAGVAGLLDVKIVGRKSRMKPIERIDGVFEQEVAWMQKKISADLELADKKIAEELNIEMATADGSLIECGCCCGDYPFESIVQCTEGHLFCKTCLQRYVEQTVFGDGRSLLKCMNTMGEVCAGHFSDEMIRLSLSDKVFVKYSQAQTRDALKAAEIAGLVVCHACSLQVEMAEEAGSVLTCPTCSKDTCRLCGDESHVPLKCSEVEKKGQTSKRLSVEEAMTEARIRECPKCKTRFFKTEGCNKMTCTCNTLICYICRKDVTKVGYAHFCQQPHCDHSGCGKCKLYTDSVEDDRKAMLDAGLKSLQQAGGEGEGEKDDKGNATNVRIFCCGFEQYFNRFWQIEIAKLLEGGIPAAGAKAPAAQRAAGAQNAQALYDQYLARVVAAQQARGQLPAAPQFGAANMFAAAQFGGALPFGAQQYAGLHQRFGNAAAFNMNVAPPQPPVNFVAPQVAPPEGPNRGRAPKRRRG